MKTPPLKAPKFGGKRKTGEKNAPKKVVEQWGPVPKRASGAQDTNVPGNREFGFIQSTPKKATGAMMGRPPPKMGKTHTRSDGRKQFKKTPGAKVF